MIIQIDEEIRITGTEDGWQLEKLHLPKKEGKAPYWKPFKWFTSFSQALTVACQREIRLHPADSISKALEAAQSVTKKYAAIFDVEWEINKDIEEAA